MTGRGSTCRQRGMILVIVLWMMTLLSVMAGSFAYSMRTETRLAAYGVEQAQARALAEAGVAYAALQVLAPAGQPSDVQPWPVDGSERQWRFGQGQLRIAVTDAGGLIDLNGAEPNLLRDLLVSAGVPPDRAGELRDAIEDWRDADGLRRPNGAEAEDYRAAGWPAGPKNAPFESVEELQQVLGMDRELYQKLARGLTIYSDQSGVDPRRAPALVLAALPGMTQKAVDDYLQRRAEHAEQGLEPPPPPVNAPYLSQAGGQAYHVSVTARLDTGVTAFLEAVIGRSQKHDKPYQIHAWQEGR